MFLLWLRVAVALYAVASVSALPAVLYNRPGWKKICVPAAISAFFFHFVSLIEMLSASHHSLPVGMHEVQSLLALLICAAFLLVALLYRTVSFGVFRPAPLPAAGAGTGYRARPLDLSLA